MGAMVLRDRLVRDMTFEDMRTVLGPKVDGSRHLDRLLGDCPLDFFIYFSSMMQVLGNLGQANYVTANAAFPALAAQRRKRGLAASIVDIGAVSGAGAFGVFSRESGDGGDNSLLLVGLRRVSEVDVYQVLAEAISSGSGHLPLGPGEEPAIGLGMRFVSPSEPSLPRWFGNPKFAGFVLRDEDEDSVQRGFANKNAASVQERLLQAQSTVQIHEAVRDSFLAKVRPMLQIEGADDDALMRMRSDEIGMDSLIAVDIRSWFLKQLSISIPVLKILNGVSIGELVDEAVAKMSPELVPNLNSASPPSPRSAGSSPPSSSSSSDPDTPATPATETTSRVSDEKILTPASGAFAEQGLLPLPKGKQSEIRAVMTRPLTFERSISLSHTQSMFWVVHSLLEDKTTLNHTGFTRMTGRVRVQDLRVAVQQLSNRHESMRACFYLDDHVVMQGILKTGRVELEHREIGSYEDVEEEFDRLKKHVYDLARGEFMRIILLTRADCPTDNYLMIGAHHVNFDGMCTQIILRDLEAFYARRAHLTLSPMVKQYSAFIEAQRQDETTGAWDGDLAFWRREFATIPEALPLTRARISARRPLLRYDVHLVEFKLDPSLAERVRAVARQHRGGTAFHFYLAAFRILLQRFLSLGVSDGRQDQNQAVGDDGSDICIGIADANRHDEETLGSVGPYMNLLALRFRDRPATFASALASARDKAFAALNHAAAPFDAVLRALRVPRDVSHAPLFQAFLDYRLGFPGQQPFADCTLEAPRFELGRTAYDLSVDIIDNNNIEASSSAAETGAKGGGDVLVSVYGQAALYEEEHVRVLAASFEDLIREFAREPGRSLVGPGSEWSYRDADVNKALELGTGPSYKTRWPSTLAHRLDDVVAAHADKLAIRATVIATSSEGEDDTLTLTYRELDDKINAIAAALMENGVSRGQYVAVYQEPTPDWICSMLAILKIGGVYVPLDPGTPAARLAMVVATCRPTALLVGRTTLPGSHALVLALDTHVPTVIEVSTVLVPAPESNVQRSIPTVAESREPAIALHTSGTTGAPKVIVLTHANLAHEVETSAGTYGLDSGVTVLQQSASGFDMSVLQIFLALALGGTLVVVPREFRGDAAALTQCIVKHEVTYTCATPTEYRSWFRHGDCAALRRSHWSVALSGGEAVDHSLLGAFREQFGVGAEPFDNTRPFRLFNGYGPAETTCCSASIELTSTLCGGTSLLPATIPAGPACPNESVYVLDEEMRPLPLGLPGEICIGGVAVAHGYLESGDPVLTARAFVRNPFATQEYVRKGWTTMFRTGDRGRLLPDGSVVVEGRIGDDTQIKIRGVRTDLRDIEQTIVQASEGAIVEAVAVARTISGSSAAEQDSKFIVGYVVFDAGFLSHLVDTLEQRPTAATYNARQVQSYLARLLANLPLPRTVRPGMLIPIDKVPRTTSGKTDRRAAAVLPLDRSSASPNFARQREPGEESEVLTDMELRIRAMWEQVLNSQPRKGEHATDHAYESDSPPLVTTRDTDFFHVGGTSMLLLDLREQIKIQLGLSVPLMQLFEHSTLGAMGTFFTTQEANQQAEAASAQLRTHVDWEAEATPSHELHQLAAQLQFPLPRSRNIDVFGGSSSSGAEAEAETKQAPTVVLTGASGILGRQVLERLLAAQRTGGVGKIICVALRQAESRVASGALPAPTAGLLYLPGDLRRERLGLTPAEWASVVAQADAIVHVGAEVSHTKTYATLRSANVAATAELAKLCLEAQLSSRRDPQHGPRPVPFHFVSTGEIPMLGGANRTEEVEIESETLTLYEESVRSARVVPDQGDAVARGYAATKWVGERMLENLAEASTAAAGHHPGFRVWIHRPSAITTPQDESAVGPDAPILPRILFYSRLLRAVPGDATSGGFGIRGSMDFVPLDAVAGDIVDIVAASCDGAEAVDVNGNVDDKEGTDTPVVTRTAIGVSSGGVTYVHHSGGTVMELATLREALEAEAEQSESAMEAEGGCFSEKKARARFEVLSFSEWTDRAEAAGLHPLLAGLFRGVEQQKKAVVFPRFVKGPR